MVITDPKKLRSKLASVAPTHVAVAYFGSGWQKYLTNLDTLEEVIVSPTIGSYPGALTELLDEAMQHDFRVYFHNTLHAKLFIGLDACLIGSANLSQNGFEDGLNEAAVYLTDSKCIDQAHDVFETLKQGAVHDADKQRTMIRELWTKWNLARRDNVLPNEGGERPQGTILDWKPGYERVWLAWVDRYEEPVLNEPNVRQAVPELGSLQPVKYFDCYTTLVEGDDVREGDWLIIWIAKGNGMPHLGMSPYWMRVDQLISGGVAEDGGEEYTQLAVMLPSNSEVTPPFDIDDDPIVKNLIKQLLVSDNYPKLLWSEEHDPWRFTEAWADNQRFLVDLQQAYSDEVSER